MQTLWGDLVAGPYKVGFQSSLLCDYSRSYQQPRTPENISPRQSAGRPMAVQIWYPAEPDADMTKMPHKAYLDVPRAGLRTEPCWQSFCDELEVFLFETACEERMGERWAELDDAQANGFQGFLQSSTVCFKDAPPLQGAFPLLIHHQGLGGGIVDNPELLEFLASYGYVVVASTFQPEHGLFFGVDGDLTRSIKDIAFLINSMCQDYGVDPSRIGLLGHSYGASAVLSYASESQANIQAVVSLDSTQEWNAQSEPISPGLAEHLSKGQMSMPPLMVFTMDKPSVGFGHYDELTYCDRYYIRVKHLGHKDFVTPGLTAKTYLSGKPDAQTRLVNSTSIAICESALAFLDAYVKEKVSNQNTSDQRSFGNRLKTIIADCPGLSVQVCKAEPMPMSATALLENVLAQGAETACMQVDNGSVEIGTEQILEVGRALQERGKYEDALLLYQAQVRQTPYLSVAYERIGDIYHELKDRENTRVAWQTAVDVLAKDSTLSAEQKAYRQQYLSEDINLLK